VSEVISVKYDPLASVYDRRYDENDYSGIQQSLFEFLGEKSNSALEVGCGTGHWITLLEQSNFKIVGLEPSRKMLEIAGHKSPKSILVQGRAEALPYCEGSFDRIFCINSFHHFHDPNQFMVEAHRVLKKDGGVTIVGLDPHTGLDHWWIYDYFPQVAEIDNKRCSPTQKIRDMMNKNGFTECSTIEAQHLQIYLPARYALESGRLAKSSTSQLSLLSEEEYNRGIEQIQSDIQSLEAKGDTLNIGLDLRLYATNGWAR
jgi:ubiquinone/menaquinone biosynthesis C-methylase UbiE